jgi:hypothetical protein
MLSYEQHLRQPQDAMRCVVRVEGTDAGGGYQVSSESQKIVRHRRCNVPIATTTFEFRDDAIDFAASIVEECVLNQGFILCD